MLVTDDLFADSLQRVDNATRIAYDLETTGLDPFGSSILIGVAIGLGEESFYFPFRHRIGPNLSTPQLDMLLKVAIKKQWTTWNGKFDLKFTRKDLFRTGINAYPPKCEDVMIASHMIDENQPNFKLKDTGDRYARYILPGGEGKASAQMHDLDAKMMDKGLGHGDMWRMSSEDVAPYAEQDVILTERLRNFFIPALARWELYDLWQETNDFLLVVCKMEERGMALDFDRIAQNVEQAQENAASCIATLRQLAGLAHLNPNSANVFKAYLNTELMIHYGTSITSTDVPALQEVLTLIDKNDKLRDIIINAIDYRRWAKVNSTYYQAFLNFQAGGVLHPNLHMTGTVTGRFSSSDPNMQAMPRKEEVFQPKNHVKEVFVARPGYWLVQIDYKMAEIYIGSHIAKAQNMIDMLKRKVDVHAETATLMGGIPRSIGKRLNFAVMYGIGADKFVVDVKEMAGIDITLGQAASYIARYQQIHPEMKMMYRDLEQEAKRNGFIRMITGRVRRYNGSEVYSQDGYRPSPYQKASSNMVQGSVAEVMRIASTAIDHTVPNAWQLLHVHDSILSEVRAGDFETIRQMQDTMCIDHVGDVQLAVPLRVDVEVGTRWSDLKPLKEVIGVKNV